jgi:hypothetical protein
MTAWYAPQLKVLSLPFRSAWQPTEQAGNESVELGILSERLVFLGSFL